jgi:hypothetical protein
MTSPDQADTPEERLAAIRRINRTVMRTVDFGAWRGLHAVEQLCMGTISVAQALRQAEDD